MVIKRDAYLQQLIERKNNGMVKVITGIRRCGKSFLLFNIFKKYLLDNGIDPDHIIEIALDGIENEELRNPKVCFQYIKNFMKDDSNYYLLLDEKFTINGKEYLLELPIRGDITLLKASKADKAGNISFNLTSGTISNYMAYASDIVIVEVEELVEIGEIDTQRVDIPAPLVDMIYVKQGKVGEICNAWKRAKAKAEGSKQ